MDGNMSTGPESGDKKQPEKGNAGTPSLDGAEIKSEDAAAAARAESEATQKEYWCKAGASTPSIHMQDFCDREADQCNR